jgi:exopolysaccharide production protein ExoZ
MRSKLEGLQILRCLAASFVVIDHMLYETVGRGWMDPGWLQFAPILGHIGVSAFFVTSGFIMYVTASSGFGSARQAGLFAVRRAIRIVPLYWLATAVASHDQFAAAGYPARLLMSLFFIPYVNADGVWQPVLGVGWTLNYEMFFYAVFALCMIFPRRIGLTLCFSLLGVLGVAGLAFDMPGISEFYAHPMVLLFAIGIFLGILFKDWGLPRAVLPAGLALTLVVVTGTMVVAFAADAHMPPGLVGWAAYSGVATALVLIAVAATPERPRVAARALVAAGDASYDTYLFHGFMLVIVVNVWTLIGLPVSGLGVVALIALVLVAANVGGYLIHRVIDPLISQPLDRAAKRKWGTSAVSTSTEMKV